MAMSEQRRLAAIMFTDTVGYSTLMQTNETLALDLLEEQKELLHPLISQHGGQVIKPTGDGFFVEFPSVVGAVRCALAAQRALAERNETVPPEREIQIRIGIHVGDVVFQEGDVYGDGVNIAARIEPFAEPGGICLTHAVVEQVRNKIPEPIESLGKRALKNIQEPMELYKVEPAKPRIKPDGAPQERKSIAVLPFANLSPDPENEYFSDGLTEELIDALAKIEDLKVISRTSAFHLKGKDLDLRAIGQKLSVSTVLEGSVRRAGDRVRITAQLINVADDAHLWSEKYDRKLEDVFAVQEEIALAIVETLKPKLLKKRSEPLVKRSTESLEAYNFYLQGRYFWNKRSKEGLHKALDYFQRAIEIDPNYALAYAGLADAYGILASNGHIPPEEGYPKAKQAAQRALELDDALAEAHTSLAFINFRCERDFPGAEQQFKKALELNPSYATAHHWYSILLQQLGRTAESLAEIQRAQDLDPLSPIIILNLGKTLMSLGRVDEALTHFKHALEIDPSSLTYGYMALFSYYTRQYDQVFEWVQKVTELAPHFAIWYLVRAWALYGKAQYEEAWIEARKAQQLAQSSEPVTHLWAESLMGITHARQGHPERARQILENLKKRPYQEDLYCATACLHLGLNEINESFEWFERAYQAHEQWLVALKIEPLLDPLRLDPRFTELLKKVGLA